LRDLLGPLGLVLGGAPHDVERVTVDVEDPEGDDLVLVADAARVVDDRAGRQPLGCLVAIASPGLAELVVLAGLDVPATEEDQHAFSSPRWFREEPMSR